MKTANILAVETSAEVLTAAVRAAGRDFAFRSRARAAHDETILKAVDAVLKKAGLKLSEIGAITAASGPGRFTGIRTGMAFAAVAADRLGVPALAVSRLEALAFRLRGESVCAVIPGWRGEKYYQLFHRPYEAAPPKPAGPPGWVGPGPWEETRAHIEKSGALIKEAEPEAADLLEPAVFYLARRRLPCFEPLYLKPASYEAAPKR